MRELTIPTTAGRQLRVYDTAPGQTDRLAVLWHHGTPNVGEPPAPLLDAAGRLGIRWIGYDRPGYGDSTPEPDRTIASAGAYAEQVLEALEIERFAVAGHSGGACHALATAALLPDRVVGGVAIAALAPYDAAGLDWFAGMGDAGVATLRAALAGREARERHQVAAARVAPNFAEADWEALRGPWSWFGPIAEAGSANGPGPQIDDDLAYAAPWGADLGAIRAPILLVHGDLDGIAPSSHAAWLADQIPRSELRRYPDDGHISVLRHAEAALEWLVDAVETRRQRS